MFFATPFSREASKQSLESRLNHACCELWRNLRQALASWIELIATKQSLLAGFEAAAKARITGPLGRSFSNDPHPMPNFEMQFRSLYLRLHRPLMRGKLLNRPQCQPGRP